MSAFLRLWNSTLVEDYPNVYSVNIKSRAKMHLPPSLMILQNPADDEAQVSTGVTKLIFIFLKILDHIYIFYWFVLKKNVVFPPIYIL